MYAELSVCVVSVKTVLFIFSVFKELFCNLLEQCVGKNVLFLFFVGLNLLAKLFKLGLKVVGGTAGDLLIVADYLLNECGVDGSGSFAVVAADHSLEFLGNELISFACYNVKNSLCADYLRCRSYERRVTCVFSYSRNLFKNLCELFALSLLLELRYEV